MSDVLFQQFSTVQDNTQPNPPTIASAGTITPTTRLTFVSGSVQVVNIIPPTTGYCEIVLIFTSGAPAAFGTNGNIQAALQPIQNIPVSLYYDPVSAKWWGSVGVLS